MSIKYELVIYWSEEDHSTVGCADVRRRINCE